MKMTMFDGRLYPLSLALIQVLLVPIYGCLESTGPAPSGKAPKQNVDSARQAMYSAFSDRIGNFAPMKLGNEWVYQGWVGGNVFSHAFLRRIRVVEESMDTMGIIYRAVFKDSLFNQVYRGRTVEDKVVEYARVYFEGKMGYIEAIGGQDLENIHFRRTFVDSAMVVKDVIWGRERLTYMEKVDIPIRRGYAQNVGLTQATVSTTPGHTDTATMSTW